MTTTASAPKRLFDRPVLKHRFFIGDYVLWNSTRPIGGDEVRESYDAVGMGRPRTIGDTTRIHNIFRWDDGNQFHDCVKLDNNNNYFPHDLTYRHPWHCCHEVVVNVAPRRIMMFLRALWLTVGGMKSTLYVGWNGGSGKGIEHHDIQFSEDWNTVVLNIRPYIVQSFPTNIEGLRLISKFYNRNRPSLSLVKTKEAMDEFLAEEKKFTVNKAEVLKEKWNDCIHNLKYARSGLEEWLATYSETVCLVEQYKNALRLMHETGSNCHIMIDRLSSHMNDVIAYKRECDGKRRIAERLVKDEVACRTAYENATNIKGCMPVVDALIKNGIIGGFASSKGQLSFLFNGFDMKIGPSKKCEIEEDKCRCQIVIPGTIRIPQFIVFVSGDSHSLYWGVKKHRKDVYHPHFRSDGNTCAGGYESAINSTLKVFDIGGFLLIMADYIHSFNVHSLLTDSKMFEFTPKKKIESRHGIFIINPDQHERGECENCGERRRDCECDDESTEE